MISLILAKKIFSMLLMILAGFALVKLKVVEAAQSKVLSLIVLWLLIPCSILTSFHVNYERQVFHGLLLATGTAVLLHIWMIAFTGGVLRRVFHLDGVEQAAIVYPNAGNLILPVVASVLGPEMVIYTMGFIIVQICCVWSHGKMTVCGERSIEWKKIFGNINLITIYVGLFMFLTRLRFPAPVLDAVSSLGSMLGPMSMLVTGMLLADVSLERLLSYRRLWMIAFFRLILMPFTSVLLVKYSGLTRLVPGGEMILLVTLLSEMAPMASTVTQFAQVYDKNPDYASAINVVTTLLCIVTMPLMVAFYQM